jgi:5-methylcytosine-specific restriction endonuclease McrA
MSKYPNWTEDEKKEFIRLLDANMQYAEISKQLNRSITGLKIARSRLFNYEPICLGCGDRILRPPSIIKWKPPMRCIECNAKRKKDYYRKYYDSLGRKKTIQKRSKLRFDGKREDVIKRDGYKCVQCGMTRAEHRKKYDCDITVDHINGGDREEKKLDNSFENLQTLCLVCHGKKDWVRRRKDWSMCASVLKKYWEEKSQNTASI